MSRWLDLARKAQEKSISLTDTQQEPAESQTEQLQVGLVLVSAGCRGGIRKRCVQPEP